MTGGWGGMSPFHYSITKGWWYKDSIRRTTAGGQLILHHVGYLGFDILYNVRHNHSREEDGLRNL